MANVAYITKKEGILKIIEIILAIAIIGMMYNNFLGYGCEAYMAIVGLIVSFLILVVTVMVEPNWPWHCWILVLLGILCLVDGFFDMIDMIMHDYKYFFFFPREQNLFIFSYVLKIIIGVVYILDGLLTRRGGGE